MKLLALVFAVVLSGCAVGRPAPTATTYDFGLNAQPVTVAPPLQGALAIDPVRAADVIAGTGIVYRLAYDNAARPEIYSQSRWAATPAELLTQRLQQKLAHVARGGVVQGTSAVQAGTLLRVELEQFSQVFDAPQRARALVQVRASVIDTQRGSLVAQQDFRAERPTAPNAEGAVQGLREASDAVLDDIAHWLPRSQPRPR